MTNKNEASKNENASGSANVHNKSIITADGAINDFYRNFIAVSRYARWDDNLHRRETWQETVDRYVNYMKGVMDKNYPNNGINFKEMRNAILNHNVMPSMRAMMTAGPALERCNVASYNCSFIGVDSSRAFDEAMYILMCGTGVGFSVESKYVDQLPPVNEHFEKTETTIVVQDSKAGWARAFRELLALLWQGQIPNWDMSNVRPAGSRLKVFGGRASGPEPLDDLFRFCVEIFQRAAGRKLEPIECHDIMCKVGEVVVSGGVRRSALISLSNLNDYEMAKAKAGNWWDGNGQRALANNSAVYEGKPGVSEFLSEWQHLYDSKSGERGIFSLTNAQRTAESTGRRDGSKIAGTNPSLVAGTLMWTNFGVQPIERLEGKNFKVTNLKGELSDATCWKSGTNKPVHKVVLQGGHSYSATSEHKWPVWRSGEWVRVPTTELQKGDQLPNVQRDVLFEGAQLNYNEGYVSAWFATNGEKVNGLTGDYYSIDIAHQLVGSVEKFTALLAELAVSYVIENGTLTVNDANSVFSLENVLKSAGVDVNGDSSQFPHAVWDANMSEDFRRGVVQGLHETSRTQHNEEYVFTTGDRELAQQFSSLLGFYGLKVSLSTLVGDGGVFLHGLTLTPSSLRRFRNLFFATPTTNVEEKTEPFVTVEEVVHNHDTADVWDVTVYDNTHAFQLDHCVTGNCGEILLRNKGFCNLSEVVVNEHDTLEDLKKKVHIATTIGTMQSTMTSFNYLRKVWRDNAEEERLLGVSLTGQFGHPVLSGKSGMDELEKWLTEMKNTAITTNTKLAKKLGINVSAAITTVKPSGCRPWNALTTTNEGVLTLQEIFAKTAHPDGEEWWDADIQTPSGRISKTYNNGVAEVMSIRMSHGHELRSTSNHQWYIEDRGWVRTDEILPGDIIQWEHSLYTSTQEQALQPLSEVAVHMKANIRPSKAFPTHMSADLSWAVGYLWGTSKFSPTNNAIIATSNNSKGLGKVQKTFLNLFGVDTPIVSDGKMYTLVVNNEYLLRWLVKNELWDQGVRENITIPLPVRRSSAESITSFFAGIADASYGAQDSSRTGEAHVLAFSKELAKHMQDVSWAIGLNLSRSPFGTKVGNETVYELARTSYTDSMVEKMFINHSVYEQRLAMTLNGEKVEEKVPGYVTEIVSLGEMETYDVEVENTHYYYDGGFKSHNTVSQLTGVASGMHPWHSNYYIRSVRGDNKDPLTRFLIDSGIPSEPEALKPHHTTVFYFPIKAPADSVTRNELTAIEHLNIWKAYKLWWTEHNPSITVTVRENEWVSVAGWVYENWEHIGGISFLPHSDHTYKQAPYQEVSAEEFAEWVKKMPQQVNWGDLSLYELEDTTTGMQELSCTAGACDVVDINTSLPPSPTETETDELRLNVKDLLDG